jgi:hypothetical protein
MAAIASAKALSMFGYFHFALRKNLRTAKNRRLRSYWASIFVGRFESSLLQAALACLPEISRTNSESAAEEHKTSYMLALMDNLDDDPHDKIERLETQIEALGAKLESCGKFVLTGRIAMAAGAVVLAAMLLGAMRTDLTWMTGAMAAILGGAVMWGSNVGTAKQAAADIAAAEAERAALIGQIELRVIPGGRTLH